MRLPDRRRVLALVGAAGLLAACADPARTGVAMHKEQADVVFDADRDEAARPGTPANGVLSPIAGGLPSDDDSVFDRFRPIPPTEDDDDGDAPPPPPECPAAGLNEFPDQEATDNVVGQPSEGVYRWRRLGTQELTALPGFPLDVDSFERRIVSDVTPGADGEFTYRTAQPELESDEIVVTTYKVRPQAVAGPSAGDRRTGEPDRGISIARIERLDRKTGNTLSVFEPQPAVLIMPLPVVPGEPITSVGVDPASGQVLQVQGRVTTRVQVDACGEMVAGWAAETTQVYSLSGSTQRTYNYVVATQLGGLLVREYVEQQTPEANSKITFTTGQLTPDPLPAGEA